MCHLLQAPPSMRVMVRPVMALIVLSLLPMQTCDISAAETDVLYPLNSDVESRPPGVPYSYGYVDSKGKVVIPPAFVQAGHFREGRARVAVLSRGVEGKRKRACGFIDRAGDYVVPPQFDYAGEFTDGMAEVRRDGKSGFVNRKGQLAVPLRYTCVAPFGNGLAPVDVIARENPFEGPPGKWGYVDKEGEFVIRPQYELAGQFSGGLAPVWEDEDGPVAYIDPRGEVVLETDYEYGGIFVEGLAVVGREGRYGYINAEGEEVIPPKYFSAEPFSEGLAVVGVREDGGKTVRYGYVDKHGEEVIPPTYLHARPFSDGLAAVSSERLGARALWGYIDERGDYVLRPDPYLRGNPFVEGLAHAHGRRAGVRGGMLLTPCLIDKDGEVAVWGEYDEGPADEARELRVAAERTLLRVIPALAAYQADQGRPPASLEDLVPAYLPSVPLDPYTGKPLHYRIRGDICTVYSVGPNGQDDGGMDGREEGDDGDIVRELRVERLTEE